MMTPVITAVNLSANSFPGGSSSGTVIGSIAVVMSAGPFSGTLALTGTNAASFQIVGSSPAQLETNGTVAAGTYSINIVATQAGAGGSPFPQPETITGVAGTAYLSAVSTLLPAALGSSAVNTTIPNGSSAVLTWDSAVAGSCAGTGFSTGSAVSGTATVSPTTTTTYSVNCGGNIASATVTVSGTLINAQPLCAAHGGGDGSSATPWKTACMQAAIDAAASGDTVFLAAGNWALSTADPAQVTVFGKSINLVGAGSGNSFDSYGHISNASGVDFCPVGSSPTITCVYGVGTSYTYGAAPNRAGGILFGTFSGRDNACANELITHIFFDGSLVTDGGDDHGLIMAASCAGPVVFNDIRVLAYNEQTVPSGTETQAAVFYSSNIGVYNSVYASPLFGGSYVSNAQVFETVLDNTETLANNVFWEYNYNPTDIANLVYTGNILHWVNNTNVDHAFGVTGCTLNPNNVVGYGCSFPLTGNLGVFNITFTNNMMDGGAAGLAVGGGVNDPSSEGGVSNFQFTGNWIFGSTGVIDSCTWHFFNDQGNCAPGRASGPMLNGTANTNCTSSTNNGDPWNVLNNSISSATKAVMDAQGTNSLTCHLTTSTTAALPVVVYNFNAHQNYLTSPANQYLSNGNTIGASVSNNVGDGINGQGGMDVAVSSFTANPTVSGGLGTLSSGKVNFSATTFTAQYGAVQWLASVSPTTPTSGGQSGTGALWSYTPPVLLSAVSHGDTVYLWTMDSLNHISSPWSAQLP